MRMGQSYGGSSSTEVPSSRVALVCVRWTELTSVTGYRPEHRTLSVPSHRRADVLAVGLERLPQMQRGGAGYIFPQQERHAGVLSLTMRSMARRGSHWSTLPYSLSNFLNQSKGQGHRGLLCHRVQDGTILRVMGSMASVSLGEAGSEDRTRWANISKPGADERRALQGSRQDFKFWGGGRDGSAVRSACRAYTGPKFSSRTSM